jgi:hypothetical protein
VWGALLLGSSAAGLWLAWPWIVPLATPVPTSGVGSDLVVVLDGGSGRFAAADRIGQALPQPPRHLLIRCPRGTPPPRSPPSPTGCATSPRPAVPLEARAFALARLICLPPAPASTASCFGMPCASPFGAPLGPPALGSLPRLVPANGRIVGCRALGREGSAGLSVLGCRRPRFWFRQDALVAARAPRPDLAP